VARPWKRAGRVRPGGARSPEPRTGKTRSPVATVAVFVGIRPESSEGPGNAADAWRIRLDGVRIDPALQGGVFGPVSGALQNTALQLTQGTVPVVGMVRYCIFYAGCNSGSLTQTLVDHTINGMLEASGVGGLFTLGGEGQVRFSMLGAPWTLKTVSYSMRTNNAGITFPTARGFAHGPASLTSSTAVASSGVVQLVTATQITTLGVGIGFPGNADKNGRISRMTLHFTPEPGLLLLLGAGAVGIAVIGRGRTRR